MESTNINNKLDLITDSWKPRVIVELNGQHIKISKVKGEFVWHDHKNEDELFIILKGTLQMNFRDKIVEVKEGEMIMINFTRLVRPDNIKRALSWAVQIAISLAHKWWRKYEK